MKLSLENDPIEDWIKKEKDNSNNKNEYKFELSDNFLEDNNNHNVVMNIGYIIKKGEVFNNIEKIYINEVKRILDNNIVGIHNDERKQGA